MSSDNLANKIIGGFRGSRQLRAASRPLPKPMRTLEPAGEGLILRQSQLQERLHANLEPLKPVALSQHAKPLENAGVPKGRALVGAPNLCKTGLET